MQTFAATPDSPRSPAKPSTLAARVKQPVARKKRGLRQQDLIFVLRNLSTLISNGVSLPKALAAVGREDSMRKHAELLDTLRRKVEMGETFSGALCEYPETFSELMVNQIRVGERSGALGDTLEQVTAQLEQSQGLRSHVLKKLAYPAILAVMGTGVVSFMLIFVVPVFEETYADSNIPLPLITQFMIGAGRLASNYGWIALLALVAGVFTLRQIRRNDESAYMMDRWILKLPFIGPWLRDVAVLQLMDVLGNLMEAGFLLAEALGACAASVGNQAVRKSVHELQAAIQRGERFSREIERQAEMFPPVVSQLVIIGEQTGKLASATQHIRQHLRREIERKTSLMVGTIEPVLTISLATCIAVILLAIYLPMFDMIGTVQK